MQRLPSATSKAPSRHRCARALLDGLPPVMWFIRAHMRRHRAYGISVPQFRTLVLIGRYPTASLSAISEHLGCALPSASRMVQGLVTRKLVVRRGCREDRRQVALDLTARGRSILETAREGTLELLAGQVSGLSETQQNAIAAAMDLLRTAFGERELPAN
ncbi:MAG: MarR family transcriptional regulator [Tepidisphaeraceae bacterium]